MAHLESESLSGLLGRLREGSIRTASRLITRAENADSDMLPILVQLFEHSNQTPVLGITGPPGSGKSTLLSHLIERYRAKHKRVAVLAVDPSSPFSGGAILGDRVRMQKQALDSDVFIRSMAARDHLGGLASASLDALTILKAMNFDLIILETAGVGQSEVDIMRQANQVLVLQNPGAGDEVQAHKAGLLEIGDLYIVNKSDLPGAEQTAKDLREALSLTTNRVRHAENPVLLIDSLSQKGVQELVAAIEANFAANAEFAKNHSNNQQLSDRRLHQVAQLCQRSVNQCLSQLEHQSAINPYLLAGQVMAEATKLLNSKTPNTDASKQTEGTA